MVKAIIDHAQNPNFYSWSKTSNMGWFVIVLPTLHFDAMIIDLNRIEVNKDPLVCEVFSNLQSSSKTVVRCGPLSFSVFQCGA